ncbi:hypothetical protein [Silanimonas sp.]|uniref:hypothetical protein n=1 Tax=Silanimonas sp. TaxID=1929290 RepID=UPI0022C35C57|nr:hypothetical protein [Silanimonas sp.]MCZ8114958.1 hypothetical protein [Silanimonas sp.]
MPRALDDRRIAHPRFPLGDQRFARAHRACAAVVKLDAFAAVEPDLNARPFGNGIQTRWKLVVHVRSNTFWNVTTDPGTVELLGKTLIHTQLTLKPVRDDSADLNVVTLGT